LPHRQDDIATKQRFSGNTHIHRQTLKKVLSPTAESERGALFYNDFDMRRTGSVVVLHKTNAESSGKPDDTI
jgi:hypothetical protein